MEDFIKIKEYRIRVSDILYYYECISSLGNHLVVGLRAKDKSELSIYFSNYNGISGRDRAISIMGQIDKLFKVKEINE